MDSASPTPVLFGQVPRLALPAINRKAGAEITDILSHARLGRSIVAWPSRQRAQHLDDVAPDHTELPRAEAAGRRRRRAEGKPGGCRRLCRIERDPDLIARNGVALAA